MATTWIPRPDYPALAARLHRRSVSNAHAVILATPEYHGGSQRVLKNTLDLLSGEASPEEKSPVSSPCW